MLLRRIPLTLRSLLLPPLALAFSISLSLSLIACGAGAPTAPSPSPPASAPDATAPPASFPLRSSRLGEVRRINVYTPPGYVPGRAPLPVLYMPDGGVEEDFPHLTATVDRLIRERAIAPLLVVGIENTERRRDLTGPTEVAKDREVAPRVGGSANFRAFLRDELMPELARRYCVGDDTAIIGESFAGLFIVETLLLEPALFRRYVALSPSLWWNAERLAQGAAAHLARLSASPASPASPRALYLASAGDDLLEGLVRFADSLRGATPSSLIWSHQPHPELGHGAIYRARSAAAITAITARPAVAPAATACAARRFE